LIGSWKDGEVTLARAGRSVVAVIGASSITATALAELVARLTRVEQLDTVTRGMAGCAHVVASVDGVVRVQGSLSGLRQVFHTRHAGVVVAGDRAHVLAQLTGVGVDEEMLAVRVACPTPLPPPLAQRSLWRAVHTVPSHHYLRLDVDGQTTRSVRRWTPPTPSTPLADGAKRLRQALVEAVAVGGTGGLGSDLSGGMGSTSLCFLAARTDAARAGLVTFRWRDTETGNESGNDTARSAARAAARAAAALPCATHLVLAQEELPARFAIPDGPAGTEAPRRFAPTLARAAHSARVLAEHGVRVHLAGHGGHELLHDNPAYLHDLLRTRPFLAVARVRAHQSLARWPWRATIKALFERRGLDAWWREQADRLTGPPPPRRTPVPLHWGRPLRAPAWVTPAAVEAARGVLRASAEHAQPLAPQRGQHDILAMIGARGPTYRQLADVFAEAGVSLRLPFLDDGVIDAALSVRQHELRSPWRHRPVLADAMRGTVPSAITSQAAKVEFGQGTWDGLASNRGAVLEVLADSRLAAAGLIDPDRVRADLLAPPFDDTTAGALGDLLGCEIWLRANETATAARLADELQGHR
jgi:asparagine synthase (glutamine-hydrolysing)